MTKAYANHHKGVYHYCYPGRPERWVARIWDDGKKRHLGYFVTEEAAIAAYRAAEATQVLRESPHRRVSAVRYPENADYVEIELSRKRWAKIDKVDLDLIGSHCWSLSNGYAERVQAGQHIYMHRQIFGGDDHVDHANHDTLDNRRSNLRSADKSENGGNKRKTRGTSRFKGVCWDKQNQKWYAQIGVRGRQYFLGYFTDEEDAAWAYNRAARRAWPNHALLNDVPPRILRRSAPKLGLVP
jgi:hypothetical protein